MMWTFWSRDLVHGMSTNSIGLQRVWMGVLSKDSFTVKLANRDLIQEFVLSLRNVWSGDASFDYFNRRWDACAFELSTNGRLVIAEARPDDGNQQSILNLSIYIGTKGLGDQRT